jgi:hypothetical protein
MHHGVAWQQDVLQGQILLDQPWRMSGRLLEKFLSCWAAYMSPLNEPHCSYQANLMRAIYCAKLVQAF